MENMLDEVGTGQPSDALLPLPQPMCPSQSTPVGAGSSSSFLCPSCTVGGWAEAWSTDRGPDPHANSPANRAGARGNNSSNVNTLHSAETQQVWQAASRKASSSPHLPVFTPWCSLRHVKTSLHDREYRSNGMSFLRLGYKTPS